VRRLSCDHCGTALEGRFTRGRIFRLTPEQLAFVEVFLECRGKIKDVEGRLGISYPTVVSRLEQVVQALGSAETHVPHAKPRTVTDDVLESLARGELTPAEAAERLRTKKKEGGS